jgi:ankyrin repeat protein
MLPSSRFDLLPTEVVVHIISFLPAQSLIRTSLVCRNFYDGVGAMLVLFTCQMGGPLAAASLSCLPRRILITLWDRAAGGGGKGASDAAIFCAERGALPLLYRLAARVPHSKHTRTGAGLAALVIEHINDSRLRADALTILLKIGVPYETRANNGLQPIHVAAACGATRALRVLLAAGADAGAQTPTGHTSLHFAAARGHAGCISALIRSGSPSSSSSSLDLDATTPVTGGKGGETATHCAASRGATRCLRLLLNAGASFDVRLRNGRTPLYLACEAGSVQSARVLIRARADLNLTDDIGRTPLHIVAARRDVALTQLLVKAGAETQATTKIKRQTPLQQATAHEARRIAAGSPPPTAAEKFAAQTVRILLTPTTPTPTLTTLPRVDVLRVHSPQTKAFVSPVRLVLRVLPQAPVLLVPSLPPIRCDIIDARRSKLASNARSRAAARLGLLTV